MPPQSFHIKLITDHVSIDGRVYRTGAVVEVDKYRRKGLVEHGHAEDHAGPAFEPEISDEPAAAKRTTKVERATRI
jgi:hypothetical protein